MVLHTLGVLLREGFHLGTVGVLVRQRPSRPTANGGIAGMKMRLQRFKEGVAVQRFAALHHEREKGASGVVARL